VQTRLPSSSAFPWRRSTSGDTRAPALRRIASAGTSGTSRPPCAHGSMNIWRIGMAHVERRERRGKNGQVLRSYGVRWRGPDGNERNKSFRRNGDADRFAATVSADLVRGQPGCFVRHTDRRYSPRCQPDPDRATHAGPARIQPRGPALRTPLGRRRPSAPGR
jgi:hypothetical protein